MKWANLLNTNRPRPSTMDPDHRAEFERDFDRSIFSTPVKRLQDKAQVFPLDPHDAVRTRLTHSLEVSAVARGLAISVGKWLLNKKDIKPGTERQIEAIAGTCGIIHDLGNPPFGHVGEEAIREWFEKRIGIETLRKQFAGDEQRVQDLMKFEGNSQTLRLVSKLQILADFNGLNLTFGTLSTARKYIARADEADKQHVDHGKSKPGFFASENKLIERVEQETGTAGVRNPITYLVEAADDMVYRVADIEDGIKKGIVTWKQIDDALRGTDVDDKSAKAVFDMKDRILKPAVTKDLPDDVHGAAFRTAAIGVLVPDAVDTFKKHYDDIMMGKYTGELVLGGNHQSLIRLFKKLGHTVIYCTPPNLKLELMGRKIIQDLMDLFWDGASYLPTKGTIKTDSYKGRIAALFSRNYRDVFRNSVETQPEVPELYHRYQLVTDYVCGMTDTFARRLHRELTNA